MCTRNKLDKLTDWKSIDMTNYLVGVMPVYSSLNGFAFGSIHSVFEISFRVEVKIGDSLTDIVLSLLYITFKILTLVIAKSPISILTFPTEEYTEVPIVSSFAAMLQLMMLA